jgi:hypothetical protein
VPWPLGIPARRRRPRSTTAQTGTGAIIGTAVGAGLARAISTVGDRVALGAAVEVDGNTYGCDEDDSDAGDYIVALTLTSLLDWARKRLRSRGHALGQGDT